MELESVERGEVAAQLVEALRTEQALVEPGIGLLRAELFGAESREPIAVDEPGDHERVLLVWLLILGAPRGSTPSGSGRRGLPPSVPPVLARAVDQLHEGHGRPIPRAKAAFQDAQIAAGPLPVARPKLAEQLGHHLLVAQPREGQPALGDAVLFRERDQGLGGPPQLLGLG